MNEKELITYREEELNEAVIGLLNTILKSGDCRNRIYSDFYMDEWVSAEQVIADIKETVLASLAQRYNLNIWRPGYKRNVLTGERVFTEYPYDENEMIIEGGITE